MDYQVWTKEEFQDGWGRTDCGDLIAAKRQLDKAVRAGLEPLLTVEVPFKLDIKVSEVGTEPPKKPVHKKTAENKGEEVAESEASQSEAGPGEDPGSES